MRGMKIAAGLLATSVAPAARAGAGAIDVRVVNAPGEIVLDGFPTGQKAPGILEQVAPGTHEVGLEYGCMIGRSRAVVSSDQTTEVDLRLENRGGEGTIRLRGVPVASTVLMDEAPVRRFEDGIRAPCGGHRLRVEAPGYQPWEGMAVVTTGKWSTVEVSLEAAVIEQRDVSARSARPVVSTPADVAALDELDEARGGNAPALDSDFDEPEDWAPAADRDSRRARAEDEERRRRAEEEARRAREEARRAEQRRALYGDVDSLDEPRETGDEPLRGDSRPSSRPRRSDRDIQGMALEEPDEDLPEGDFPDLDGEPDMPSASAGGPAAGDAISELDLLDQPVRRGASSSHSSFWRWTAAGGLGAAAAGGIALGVIELGQASEARQQYDLVIEHASPLSPEAADIMNNQVKPARYLAILGFSVAALAGAGSGATLAWWPEGTAVAGWTWCW